MRMLKIKTSDFRYQLKWTDVDKTLLRFWGVFFSKIQNPIALFLNTFQLRKIHRFVIHTNSMA